MPRGGPSPRENDDLVAFLETLSQPPHAARAARGKMRVADQEGTR